VNDFGDTVFQTTDYSLEANMPKRGDDRSAVVVAGPGSSLTIPGIIVSEIAQGLAKLAKVTRIEVDLNTDLMAGLHRAPSLAAAHDLHVGSPIIRHQAPNNPRLRPQVFRDLIGPDVATAIAYAWPGIDNAWIRQFIHVGRAAGALTVVACASLPQPNHARAVSLASTLANADVIIVGDASQAKELAREYGRTGPRVETHKALSLVGRAGRESKQQITAFLPKDDVASLATLLAAFDAIPEAWIDRYNLQVVMRFDDPTVEKLVANSYHRDYVQLIGENISSEDLQELCAASSALSIAEPQVDSRVFSMAVKCGIGTVVVGAAQMPEVGRGYVGGLLADRSRSASVHVALIHALRLAELQFPNPDKWDELAEWIVGLGQKTETETEVQSKVGV
jgi:hypothetical protein